MVLVFAGALVRLGVRANWLAAVELATPSLALQTAVIIFLGIALYAILKRRYHKPVIVPLGWVLPGKLYGAIGFLSGIVAALGVVFVMHFRNEAMPTLPTVDFLVLGFFLGPILEESMFRGYLLPVLVRTIGNFACVVATAVLFAAFHGPRDATHWAWFCATGVAYGWLRLASRTTSAAALMHAMCNLALFLAVKL